MNNELLDEPFSSKITIIYKYLIKIGCSHNDAEDIVQDPLFKAIIHLEAIDSAKIASWLFKVALNRYYDLCRKNKKQPLASLEIENILNNMPAADYLPENYILDSEKRGQVSRVLNGLNPIYKNLLVLKYVVGLSYRETAEVLDIKEHTVKTYIYRATSLFANQIYGIKAITSTGEILPESGRFFIEAINAGLNSKSRYQSQFKNLYDALSNDQGEITEEDIRVTGVVVTGDTGSLEQLKEKNYIKASTLGIVIDKF